jgi:hypothetical protein
VVWPCQPHLSPSGTLHSSKVELSFPPSFLLFSFETLSQYIELASNSQFSCLSLTNAGITGMHHHTWERWNFLILPMLSFYHHTIAHTPSSMYLSSPFYILLFFCSPGAWTQGLHLELLHQPYFCEKFFKIGSLELFAQDWLWTEILLISAFWVARITGMTTGAQPR